MLNLSPENLVLSKLNAFFEFLALFWEQKHRKKIHIFLHNQKKVCNFSNFSFDFFVFLVICLQKISTVVGYPFLFFVHVKSNNHWNVLSDLSY